MLDFFISIFHFTKKAVAISKVVIKGILNVLKLISAIRIIN